LLNVTVLELWLEPKLAPEIVTTSPTQPELGERPVIPGVGSTVKPRPLLATPFTVTITFPVVALAGTFATMDVALQPAIVIAATPLKVTELASWLDPKFVPMIVTGVPTAPEPGERPVMLGVGSTVKPAPLLATPLTVTTTFPVVANAGTGTLIEVAVQFVGAPTTPLKVTVLPP